MAKKIIYPPLALLRSINNEMPEAWDLMKILHESNGEDHKWDERCYAPIGAAQAVTLQLLGHIDAIKATQIAALAPWRRSKDVFVLDPDMCQLLIEQADDDLEVPVEILLNLPYTCFYVETQQFEDVNGFFVHLEHDIHTDEKELRFLFLFKDGSAYGYPLCLVANTVSDCIKAMSLKDYSKAPSNIRRNVFQVQNSSHFVQLVSQLLQIVLYICASNADIQPNSEQFLVMKNFDEIRDKYSEIHKWDLGVNIGSQIRRQSKILNPNKSHTSPRTHIRRGHWHHFWRGSRRDNSRELVLHWVAPTVVGAENSDENVIIHFDEYLNK